MIACCKRLCYDDNNLMRIIVSCRGVRKWLLRYPERIETSLHSSLTSEKGLLAVRVLALLVLTYRYVLSILTYRSAFQIVEYLTELGFFFTWTYFLLACQDYLLNCREQPLSKDLAGWTVLLFEVTLCVQSVVTALFWSILYNYSQPAEAVALVKEVGVHGFPLFVLMVDLSLNTHQFPKRHLPVVMLVGVAYLAVNVGMPAFNPVYKPLDWVSVMSYVYVAACFLLVGLIHTAVRIFWEKRRRPRLVQLLQPSTEQDLNYNLKSIITPNP